MSPLHFYSDLPMVFHRTQLTFVIMLYSAPEIHSFTLQEMMLYFFN